MWNVLFEEQHLRLVIDWPQIFKCVNQSSVICFSFDTNFINQSFSVRSRLSNDRHAARLRGSLTISICLLLLLLFKMNDTRDWNRKGSSCGRVLCQLSYIVIWLFNSNWFHGNVSVFVSNWEQVWKKFFRINPNTLQDHLNFSMPIRVFTKKWSQKA